MALLVVGDPFGATTHTDLVTRCTKMGVSELGLSYRSHVSLSAILLTSSWLAVSFGLRYYVFILRLSAHETLSFIFYEAATPRRYFTSRLPFIHSCH